MSTQNTTVFNRSVYTDFLRFMLVSLATGVVAAMLLSSAVILLSNTKPAVTEAAAMTTSDGGKRVRTTWAAIESKAVAS